MHKLVLIRHGESTWNLSGTKLRHYDLGDAEAAAAAVASLGKA